MDKSMVEVSGTVKHETDAAIFVDFGDEEVWLPKSQLEEWPELDETGDVIMPYWLALDKDLI